MPGAFDFVREDAHLFQGGFLLGVDGLHVHAKEGHVVAQVLGLDAHGKLQGIHQLALAVLHFLKGLGQGFLALGHHVLGGQLGSLLDVHQGAGLLFQVLGHLPGHFLVFANEGCRTAQVMPAGHPQEVR